MNRWRRQLRDSVNPAMGMMKYKGDMENHFTTVLYTATARTFRVARGHSDATCHQNFIPETEGNSYICSIGNTAGRTIGYVLSSTC